MTPFGNCVNLREKHKIYEIKNCDHTIHGKISKNLASMLK